MADVPSIENVEREDGYIHVRFRDPVRYDEIRLPTWRNSPHSRFQMEVRFERVASRAATTGR